MSARTSMLALAAIAAIAISALTPGSGSAFGRDSRASAPTHVVVTAHAPSVRYGYGWGYGRGWCYWHPYVCYRNY